MIKNRCNEESIKITILFDSCFAPGVLKRSKLLYKHLIVTQYLLQTIIRLQILSLVSIIIIKKKNACLMIISSFLQWKAFFQTELPCLSTVSLHILSRLPSKNDSLSMLNLKKSTLPDVNQYKRKKKCALKYKCYMCYTCKCLMVHNKCIKCWKDR